MSERAFIMDGGALLPTAMYDYCKPIARPGRITREIFCATKKTTCTHYY